MKTSSRENKIKRCSLTSNTLDSDSTSVNIHQLPTSFTQQENECRPKGFTSQVQSQKSLKTSSFYSHAQPCPFTFLTAVKCKFPVNKSYASSNRIGSPEKVEKVREYSMDSVEPLKIPNLQISPKVCRVSEKIQSSNEKLLTSKSSDSNHKTKSSNTLVSTCAEYPSSTIATKLESKNYRRLKAPDTISSRGKNLLKNNAREKDYSRNKENRFKKIKKEGISGLKSRNDASILKLGSRSQEHISSQDILNKATNKAIKNDSTSSGGFKDNGNVIKTIRNKPPKYSQFSTRSNKEALVKSYTYLSQKSFVDSSHQNTNSNSNNCNSKGSSPVSNTPNSIEKPALLEQQQNSIPAEPVDAISQDYLEHSTDHKSTKGSQVSAMANVEKYQAQSLATPPLTLSTTKEDAFKSLHTQQNNAQRDSSTILSAISDSNQFSNSSMIETKLNQDSLSDKLMDPVRISFREDSYSNQPEFTNLVTPNVNLTIRSKRRKHVIQLVDSDDDYKDSKHSRKNQNVTQGVEVRAKTERDSSGQFVYVHKAQVIEQSAQQGRASSNNTWEKISDIITESKSTNTDNEEEVKNWSARGMMDKPSHLADTIQTETTSYQYGGDSSLIFSKEQTDPKETFHNISLKSGGGGEDASRIDDISLSKRMRTMSEISLHETTSSIRTESGTEISISLRDVTCSFNKNLDLEMAQLIDDERQRYNKIEMLFKSREKSLNDRTRKLVKLEEQKKALRDTGQDSRISSVKKKQRALLLKLQQEKDEMNRLKELHKIASQERKLMLQKQRDMFNPDMSTKNILHKLKRSADSQSPRRLSGPMKGYDIRSNSSMSSLIDSDKSQLDRSKFDSPMNKSDTAPLQKGSKANVKLGTDRFPIKVSRSAESHDTSFSKVEAGKFDDKMPKSDLKYQLYDFESVLEKGAIELLKDDKRISLSRSKDQNFIFENVRSKSNALIEEFTEIWESHFSQSKNQRTSSVENSSQKFDDNSPSVKLQSDANIDDNKSTKRKGLKLHKSKTLPIDSSDTYDVHSISKTLRQNSASSEALDKRDFGKNYDDSELDEFLSNAKQISVQELVKHSDLLKQRNEQLLKDIVDDRNNFAKQSSAILLPSSSSKKQERNKEEDGEEEEEEEAIEKSDNVSVQSHVSLAISHQSSNESDKSYLKSVVIRSQQDYQPNSSFQTSKKLEQILKAREATLISRRNCVEEWIAWHARLRDEEERVSRMEKAAYKLVSATARTLSLNDATISSDNSDVEGRIEVLTKKLSDRRFEMTRLKKEARKQAKRRLRALEANLLTQIKRYDATINEMRKKLETKKGPSKESTKLELESKSLNDYKVPDIPIKNIREIYKRSDLLRSQSDQCDVPKNKNHVRDEMNDIESLSSRAENGREMNDIKSSSSRAENGRAANVRTTKSINVSGEGSKSTSWASNSCKSQSQLEIQKSEIPDSYNKDSISLPSSNISGISSSKVGSVEKHASDTSNAADKLTHESEDASSSVLSNKLSNIQLHNRELNDDIHNLENDLRELSEMMLNFSKKSTDQNSMSRDSSRQTLKAIDELSPKHLLLNRAAEPKLDIKSDTIDTDLQIRVKETLSNGIPDTDNISTSIEELYSEIKSNDRVGQHSHVLESSEKSIETEELHRMSKSLRTIDEKDNKNDTCSILEIISTTVEKDSSQVLSDDSDNDLKIQDDDNGCMLAQSTDVSPQNQSEYIDNDRGVSSRHANGRDNIIQIDSKHKLEESQLSHEPQNAPYSIENNNEVLPAVSENAVDSDNVMTELDSLHGEEFNDDEGKSVERRQVQDVHITENYDRNSISDVEDSTIFVPKGESTNLLETFVLKLDNSSDIGMGICSEEFNDILEIIERETKNDDNILPESNTDVSAATKKGDAYNVIEDDHDTFNKENLDKDTKSEVSKVSTVESEKNLDFANNDVHSNKASEPAKVHKDGNDSSDGEQTNNLIEVVENKLGTLQKSAPKGNKTPDKHKTHVTVFLDKTLQVIRDPEYEDISEESLEVSDIFNNTNPALHKSSKKFTTVPEKYIIKSESNEVLRILDEISNKSNKFDSEQQHEIPNDDQIHSPIDTNKSAETSSNESKQTNPSEGNNREIFGNLKNEVALNKSSIEDVKENLDTNSEISTNLDDDKKSHVNLDTKRDSGSDIDAFSDNSVNNNSLLLDESPKDNTAEFRTTPMGVSSEKDIESMIKKLKASLEQPGIEVAEFEAKLLEIENLQIELAIKKLEAEEVSYYVREIPNKPPPPYTPPGSVRQSGSNGAFSSVSIIPTNIEELTFVTEKATAIIHVKKKSGEDVQLLEAPDEIYESVKDPSNNDAVKKNRLIYNTFLFDLCKELIVDIYKVEEENPGPSWTKPQVKTKRVIKIPKSIDELNEYVSKEVATLFGFKTKLQRENMVMRWSRKRRDRVDELLAKEAQAEEKEWTKFHHDELAVKNELTVTILNNLLMETTSCIKNAYAKKKKLSIL